VGVAGFKAIFPRAAEVVNENSEKPLLFSALTLKE